MVGVLPKVRTGNSQNTAQKRYLYIHPDNITWGLASYSKTGSEFLDYVGYHDVYTKGYA
jgi:hypothetical protein